MGQSIFGSLEVKASIEYRGFTRELTHTPLSPGRRRHATRLPTARDDDDFPGYR